MSKDFFHRLRDYYLKVAEVLRGEAEAASIFPNPSDIGNTRERIYAEFLRLHAPSKCNVFLGGFLFDGAGNESKQMDVIVATDTTPRFDFHNPDGSGKAFSPVEGCIGAVSIKSQLNERELRDALLGMASIPRTRSLEGRVNPVITISDYDDWPYKIIYASDGIKGGTILGHLNKFYQDNPTIPLSRRPNMIHVAGKYCIMRPAPGARLFSRDGTPSPELDPETYIFSKRDSDLQGIIWATTSLQRIATESSYIFFGYADLINRVLLIPPEGDSSTERDDSV